MTLATSKTDHFSNSETKTAYEQGMEALEAVGDMESEEDAKR